LLATLLEIQLTNFTASL